MRHKILVVEDDAKTAELLRVYLERDGYLVRVAVDGRDALDQIRRSAPDLVLLDLMLPKVSGLDVCRVVRAERDVPIIMVTARSTEDDTLLGLDLGADDYIAKPFSPKEVVARVRTVLRRTRATDDPGADSVIERGEIVVDRRRHEVRVRSAPVSVTPREFAVLETLAGQPGRAFSRLELCDVAFGFGYDGLERTVDVHVMNLRKKLVGAGTVDPIETVFGRGYRFRECREHREVADASTSS
jgi:DNA-binding response OmpR family regulator